MNIYKVTIERRNFMGEDAEPFIDGYQVFIIADAEYLAESFAENELCINAAIGDSEKVVYVELVDLAKLISKRKVRLLENI